MHDISSDACLLAVSLSSAHAQGLESVNFDTFPEYHAATYHLGFRLGVSVVPDGIGIGVAIDKQRVVAGLTLPGARGFVVAKGDEGLVE